MALAAAAWKPAQAAAAIPVQGPREPNPDVRSFVSGNFLLSLDGSTVGVLKSVDGGATFAEVIEESVSATQFVHKHIGQPKYEDFTMQIGMSMNKAVYDWIAASWQMNFQRKNGAIIATNFKGEAISRREFLDALITETGIPALDGSSKEAAYLTLKVTPELARDVKTSGAVQSEATKQKLWLASNFKLEIDGLDCSRVNKIDAFTVKQAVVEDDIGDQRDFLKEPGKLEFPNLKITFAETSAQSWMAWFDDFVIKGNNGAEKEKTGRLVFLSPNLQEQLAEIKFFNIGIFKLSSAKSEANSDAIKRMTAELYVERMEFKHGTTPIIVAG